MCLRVSPTGEPDSVRSCSQGLVLCVYVCPRPANLTLCGLVGRDLCCVSTCFPDRRTLHVSLTSHNYVTYVMCCFIWLQLKRGKRSLCTQKRRRKHFHQLKKEEHKERWEKIREEATIKRWKERSVKYHDGVTADAAYAANVRQEETPIELRIKKSLRLC